MKEYAGRVFLAVLVIALFAFVLVYELVTPVVSGGKDGWDGTLNDCLMFSVNDLSIPATATAVAEAAKFPECQPEADLIYATATAKATIRSRWIRGR